MQLVRLLHNFSWHLLRFAWIDFLFCLFPTTFHTKLFELSSCFTWISAFYYPVWLLLLSSSILLQHLTMWLLKSQWQGKLWMKWELEVARQCFRKIEDHSMSMCRYLSIYFFVTEIIFFSCGNLKVYCQVSQVQEIVLSANVKSKTYTLIYKFMKSGRHLQIVIYITSICLGE